MMTESDLSSPTSTSSFGDLSPKKMEDKANYRKSNKPMMEKKRRARINSCLTQLKTLVLEAMKKDNSQYSKLEKADILELTVKHLKNVQRYQGNGVTQMPDAISKYRAGFNECANEVMRYLGESQGVNDEARTRILSHLASILTPLNNLPVQQGHNPVILPALAPAQQHHHHQQQQQIHLHQLHMQHQNSVFLAPPSAGQVLSIDTNNNQPAVMPHSVYRTQNGNNMDVKNVMSQSPTAFQTPVSVGGSGGLQIPCVAAGGAMEAAQFQLVPSASGQVALVLTPQAIPALNLYASQQLGRLQSQQQQPNNPCDQVKLSQDKTGPRSEDTKPRLASDSTPVAMVMKSSKLHRSEDDAHATRTFFKSEPPSEARPASITSSSPLPYDLRQIYTADRAAFNSASLNKVSLNAITINSMDNHGNHNNNNNNGGKDRNSNVVRATSTWRPW